ncbi:MAG: FAD-dependent oxidoreductase [Clostridioides sp.]|nr:FAD-dependent oxidoreductase [Clostridioides sp.]
MSLKSLEIKKNLYWVGSLDPDLRVFDIIMYTPYGTTYNSYVLKGSEKTALFETVKDRTFEQYMERLNDLEIDLNTLDYLVVSHTEPDHAGSVAKILDLAPNAKVVASPKAIEFLKEIVNKDFQYIAVGDGDSISLGDKTLEFYSVPMLHWPDTIYTYVKEDKVLVTCDSFGSHYSNEKIINDLTPSEDEDYLDALRYYYDNIMGPFKPSMVSAIQKIADLEIDTICPGHGPVLTHNPKRIVDLYEKWSTEEQIKLVKEVTIAYVSAYGYTKTIAEHIKSRIEGTSDYKVNLFDATETSVEDIVAKMTTSKGIILGSPTILGDTLPPIWQILTSLNPVIHEGKVASAFGSWGWSGEAVDNIMGRLSQLRMTTVTPFKANFKPDEKEFGFINLFADKFVEKLNYKFTKKKGARKWKCIICNEVFEGDEPPQICPVCGASEDKFIEVYDEEITYFKDTDEHYVVVGNGAAGYYATDAIRKRNKTAAITMISAESELTYFRPSLSDGLNSELGDDFYIADWKWYQDNNINVMLNTRVEKINEKESSVSTSSEEIHYDKLIIATGSNNFIPPIPGCDLDNVYTLRSKEDLEKIKAASEKVSRVAVIGGGLLGLEAAWEFKLQGKNVNVIEAADGILSKQLDGEGSSILRKCIEEAGVEVITGAQVSSIEKVSGVTVVSTIDGTKIYCDMVVFSIGVRPNIGIVKGTSIACDRGILVDETMKTSVDNIYACGDAAQVGNSVYAIWPTSVEMGKTAGANACGDSREFVPDTMPIALDAMNTDVLSLGQIKGADGELCLRDTTNNTYKKLFVVNDKIVGAVLINASSISIKVMRFISEGESVEEVLKSDIF